jgi:hypothetical protein
MNSFDTVSSSSTPTPFSRTGARPPTIAEQISHSAHLNPFLSVEDLPRITVKGKQYVQEGLINKGKASAKRRSWISQHGVYLVEMNGDAMGEAFWSCNLCDKAKAPLLYKTGTSGNAERHLKQRHNIVNPRDDPQTSSSSGDIRSMLGAKRQKFDNIPTTADAADLFRLTLVRWIVKANIPLTGPEDEEFKNLLDLASLGSNHLVDLVPTGDTVRVWIINEFNDRKTEIKKQLLEDAQSKIHLSFDLWTSDGTTMSIIGVVAHYLDKTWTIKTRLIAVRRLYGSHAGENMSRLLMSVIQEFEISGRLGYFMTDNAESNDVCLESVLREIDPTISDSDIRERRLRCWGHILNLVAKAFLFGTNADAFELEDQANEALGREQERLEAWRRKGPVGKLHNLVVFIRGSTQRKELFKNVSEATIDEIDGLVINEDTCHLGVIRDGETRWNSTYLMITRALRKRQEIDAFIQVLDARLADKRVPQGDRLSSDDWATLAETAHILKPVYDHTMRFQSRAKEGHHGSIWEVLPSMEFILHHFECLKTQYSDLPDAGAGGIHFRTAINIAWAKLEKYYCRTDRSCAYFGSVMMHPGLNKAWFDQNWTQPNQLEWIEIAETALQDHYDRFYRYQEIDSIRPENPSPPPQPEYEPDEFDNFLTPATFYARPQAIDEYDRYKSLHPIQEALHAPLAWWRDHRNEYPTLSRMALNFFSVPAMSAECERVFSQAKLIMTTQRQHLNAETLEALLCLKQWWKDAAFG